MKIIEQRNNEAGAGTHLKKLVRAGSIGSLILSFGGTGLAWAGTNSFNCSERIWEFSLILNLSFFAITWIIYIFFRNTDLLLGNGLLMTFILLNMFWMFGFGGIYFYLLFAPLNPGLRLASLTCLTTAFAHHAITIVHDIKKSLHANKKLFSKIYCDDGKSFTFGREAVGLLEKARKDRSPFKTVHAIAAIILAPFIFSINRILTPTMGEGHGIFLILLFFAIPLMLWGVEIFTQTVITMIYYPIKLYRDTGKIVVLKDW